MPVIPNNEIAIQANTSPPPIRKIEKPILRHQPLVFRLESDTPRVISISGMVKPANNSTVTSIQTGNVVSLTSNQSAIAMEYISGCFAKSLTISPMPVSARDIRATPPVINAVICTKKNDNANAKPSSPKANRQRGKPILPLFGNTTADNSARKSPPLARIMMAPKIAVPRKTNIAAAATWANP